MFLMFYEAYFGKMIQISILYIYGSETLQKMHLGRSFFVDKLQCMSGKD